MTNNQNKKPNKVPNKITNDMEALAIEAWDEWLEKQPREVAEIARLHVYNATEHMRMAKNLSGERQAKALCAVIYMTVEAWDRVVPMLEKLNGGTKR
jgi:Fe-S cluster biosynthesis and repair protein YggX